MDSAKQPIPNATTIRPMINIMFYSPLSDNSLRYTIFHPFIQAQIACFYIIRTSGLYTLLILPFSCYTLFMTMTQTVEVPASHRLTIDVPREVPTGKALVSVTPLAESSKDISLLSLRGSCKGLDTMEAYFERKRADKALEDRNDGKH